MSKRRTIFNEFQINFDDEWKKSYINYNDSYSCTIRF